MTQHPAAQGARSLAMGEPTGRDDTAPLPVGSLGKWCAALGLVLDEDAVAYHDPHPPAEALGEDAHAGIEEAVPVEADGRREPEVVQQLQYVLIRPS